MSDREYPVHKMQKGNCAFTDGTAGSSLLKFKPAQLSEINSADYIYPSEYNHQQNNSCEEVEPVHNVVVDVNNKNPSIKIEPVQNIVVDDNTKNICTRGERDKDNSLTTTGRTLLPVLKLEPDPNLPDAGDEESNRPRSGDCVQNTGKQKVAEDITSRSRNLLPMIKAEPVQNLPDVDEGNDQSDAGDEESNHPGSGDCVQNTGKQKVAEDITSRSRNLLPMIKAEPVQNLPDVDEGNDQSAAGDEKSNCFMSSDCVQNIGVQLVAKDISSRSRNLLSIVKDELLQNLLDAGRHGDEESNTPGSSDHVKNTSNRLEAREVSSRSRDLLLPIVKSELVQNLHDIGEGNNELEDDDSVQNNQSKAEDISNSMSRNRMSPCVGSSEEHNILPEVEQSKISLIFNSYTKSSITGSEECVNLLELQQNETLSCSQDKIGGRKANMTESLSCTPDPQGQGSSFPSRSKHIRNVKQHCLQSCTVPLTRIDEQISKGHCIVNNNVITYSECKGFRIRPVQNKESQPVNELDKSDNSQVLVKTKSGRNVKMSRTAYVDEDSEREDGVENDTLSGDGNCDDSETDENEGYSSTRKDCLGLLRAQDKDKSESYIKKKSFVDSKTLSKYMDWNADITCLVCQKIMTSLTEWKKHYYNWTECSSFFVDEENCCLTCPPCKESFSHFTEWSRHMFMGGPHGDLGFNIFPRGFINSFLETNSTMLQKVGEDKIMKNTDQHSNTTENTVDKNYQNYLMLKQQISEEEDDTVFPQLNKQCFKFTVGFICKICKNKAVYCYETSAVHHVYDVHVNDGKPEYRCKTCNQYFKTEHLQRKHRIEFHQASKTKRPKSTCHICGKRVHAMQVHLLVHDNKEIPCIVCGIMIKEVWMRIHLRRIHGGKRKKNSKCICEVCGKTLSESSIREHMKTHSENRKRVSCSLCKAVVLQDKLVAHMNLQHTEKRHQCEFCGKQFKINVQLAYHIQRVHLKMAKKTCKICGTSVTNLDMHMKCHQEKLFACSICGKEFRLKHHLNTHVNGVHENIRPFKCPVCDFKFTLKHHLTAHMNAIHNMEKKSTTKTANRKKDGENTESDGHKMKRKKRKVSNEKDTKPITQSKKSNGVNTESNGHTMKRKKRKVSNGKDTKPITKSIKSK